MTRCTQTAAAVLCLIASTIAQTRPQTVAERSNFTSTATLEETRTFLETVIASVPDRGMRLREFGRSEADRPLYRLDIPPTAAASGETPTTRVLIVANIHAGEVCGKDAMQLLVREIADGEHVETAGQCDLVLVPIYNVDGNEDVRTDHRRNQNGPINGMGRRENDRGLDLNRDCIKAESAEFRALLRLMTEFDPHVVFDLHTTNGSPHAYHVTYATSLSTNAEPKLVEFARERLIPTLRTGLLERHGVRSFDYGNQGRGTPPEWSTFDHRPRFLTNYVGLRNRISLLSEAYAYDPFETRVRNTRAFVLEGLRAIIGNRETIRDLCARADAEATDSFDSIRFGTATELVEGELGEVLMGAWDRVAHPGGGTRLHRRSEFAAVTMRLRTRFESREQSPLPKAAWVVLDPTAAVRDLLTAHGIEHRDSERDIEVGVHQFLPRSGDREARAYQGHRAITLRGEWRAVQRTIPAGSILVPSHQRLARLAAQLLEPLSEDGLTTWEHFAAQTRIDRDGDGDTASFPVLRCDSLPKGSSDR
ncbi:MAG: M14 family metallopeptidase [Planctomycetota bacterium]